MGADEGKDTDFKDERVNIIKSQLQQCHYICCTDTVEQTYILFENIALPRISTIYVIYHVYIIILPQIQLVKLAYGINNI